MSKVLYTTELLRLAASLSEPEQLERVDGRSEVRSLTCGSRIKTEVQLDSKRRVKAISMDVNACAFGQASAALVERHGCQRTREEVASAMGRVERWLGGDLSEVAWPGIEVLGAARSRPARHAAILLPFRGLLAALDAAQ